MSQNSGRNRIRGIWQGMKERCLNSKCRSYKNYGERGISICNEWLDFENFYEWALSSGYEDTLQIDRIDNDGNYEPNNCRWVTPKENARNKRTNRLLTINDETKCVCEWCEETDFPLGKAYRLIQEIGEEAFVYKLKLSQVERRLEKVEAELRAMQVNPSNHGDFYTIKEACAFLGCSRLTISRRIDKGTLKAYKIGRTWRIPREELSGIFE